MEETGCKAYRMLKGKHRIGGEKEHRIGRGKRREKEKEEEIKKQAVKPRRQDRGGNHPRENGCQFLPLSSTPMLSFGAETTNQRIPPELRDITE